MQTLGALFEQIWYSLIWWKGKKGKSDREWPFFVKIFFLSKYYFFFLFEKLRTWDRQLTFSFSQLVSKVSILINCTQISFDIFLHNNHQIFAGVLVEIKTKQKAGYENILKSLMNTIYYWYLVSSKLLSVFLPCLNTISRGSCSKIFNCYEPFCSFKRKAFVMKTIKFWVLQNTVRPLLLITPR